MNTKIEKKRIWETPEVIDMEVENTAGKGLGGVEGSAKMPSAS